jgi:hypothetical protein
VTTFGIIQTRDRRESGDISGHSQPRIYSRLPAYTREEREMDMPIERAAKLAAMSEVPAIVKSLSQSPQRNELSNEQKPVYRDDRLIETDVVSPYPDYSKFLANNIYGKKATDKTAIERDLALVEWALEEIQERITDAIKVIASLKVRVERYEQQNTAPVRD